MRRINPAATDKRTKKLLAEVSLTREELDRELAKGLESIRDGRVHTADEVDAFFEKKGPMNEFSLGDGVSTIPRFFTWSAPDASLGAAPQKARCNR